MGQNEIYLSRLTEPGFNQRCKTFQPERTAHPLMQDLALDQAANCETARQPIGYR